MNYPTTVKITEAKKENSEIKTLFFEYSGEIIPGQFFMIWIPGVDEIPMSISYANKEVKAITFRKVGDATKALFKLKDGDKIGVRGPYGNGFKLDGKKILFIGGGTGIATIASAVEKAMKNKISSTVILGFKNKKELFFEDRLKKCGAEIYISTDDGSKGHKGFASDLAKKLLKKNYQYELVLQKPYLLLQ